DDDDATEVSFTVSNNTLTVTHNGTGFLPEDVERICDCARGNDAAHSGKQKKSNKIGYKGVGFKAVFKYSEQVRIKSNKFSFMFSKQHIEDYKNQKDKTTYPWQIMPIWDDSQKHLDNNQTHFVLENITNTNIKNISCALEKL